MKNNTDELLHETFYSTRTGYSGIDGLARKSGLPRKVIRKWLGKQNVYTLHKPIKHKFQTRRVLVSSIDDQWQADLVDMQKYRIYNKGVGYILTIIDIFSKYAWAIPIKKKTGEEITNAFQSIFHERKPKKIHTDKGLEFINKSTQRLLKNHNIHWFATENETKAQVVERFNRTLKTKMWKYFTQKNTKIWIDILSDLITNYNSSYHRSIKMTPEQGSLYENSARVYKNLFPSTTTKIRKPKYNIGDRVRITIKRRDFRKGYLPNFTTEIFLIAQVLDTNPPTYKLKDLDDEEVIGSFYEEEMVKYDNDIFEVEKIIRKNKGKLLVKWKGYDVPSWINKYDLVQT
jgi:transposase InsO family protein